ncbi:histone-lysine N-methyltransferase SETMAR [Trichonephila clavipes]|nr:histone-lysine N-methyltransferase SETMAR [Trichonephila clavipes]
MTPFELLFGTKMKSCQDIEIVESFNDEITAQFHEQRDALRQDAKKQIYKVQDENRRTWELQGVKNGSQQREIRFILQFFFDEGENTSRVAEITNAVYGADTVTAIYVQFWFRRIRSGIFDVKDASRTDKLVVENIDKITEIIEFDQYVSSPSITQELMIEHKTVLNHFRKVGFKKKLDVWGPPQLTPKNMMDRISICEDMAKWNDNEPFLKRMVTGDEK